MLLPTHLIFSTHALSVKREGPYEKRKLKFCGCYIPLWLCSSIAGYCNIVVIATALMSDRDVTINREPAKNRFKDVTIQIG